MTTPKVTLQFTNLTAHDGEQLRVACFKDENSSPKAVIQLVHGFAEHIESYEELTNFFVNNNYAVFIHDQRGFGLMPNKNAKQRHKELGVVKDYKDFLSDIGTVGQCINNNYPNLPIILYGHSMGGNIAINYFLTYPKNIYHKCILEAPWLQLAQPFPAVFNTLAHLLAKLSPYLRVSSKLRLNDVSRCSDKIARINEDKLFHDYMSFRLYSGVTQHGQIALNQAYQLTLPTLLLCAGNDKVVSSKAIRQFAANCGQHVKLNEYANGYHSLHTDIIKEQVLADILNFINS
jgi:lysophospholipase